MSDASLYIDPEGAEMICDDPGGSRLAIPELGVLMNVAPPRHDLRHDGIDATLELSGTR
jgi:hypothetical protein